MGLISTLGLRWQFVLEEGLAVLTGLIALALALPVRREPRAVRPLAQTGRLTALPEYVRAVRLHRAVLLATTATVLGAFCCALLASARPVDLAKARGQGADEHPTDVMLCVGTSVTNPAVSALLSYFQENSQRQENSHRQDQEETGGQQRVGLTSPTLRVVPMTADHAFAAEQFGKLASLAKLAGDAAAGKQLSGADARTLADGQDGFSRAVRYTDYQPNLIDTLASCVTGFPDFKQPSGRSRQIVYLGPTDEQPAAGTRTIYSSGALGQLVAGAKAQVNILSLSPRPNPAQTSPAQPGDVARAQTEASGGKFFAVALPPPAGGVGDNPLGGLLDQVRAHPPQAASGGAARPARLMDEPTLVLSLTIGFVALLSLCLAVVRR